MWSVTAAAITALLTVACLLAAGIVAAKDAFDGERTAGCIDTGSALPASAAERVDALRSDIGPGGTFTVSLYILAFSSFISIAAFLLAMISARGSQRGGATSTTRVLFGIAALMAALATLMSGMQFPQLSSTTLLLGFSLCTGIRHATLIVVSLLPPVGAGMLLFTAWNMSSQTRPARASKAARLVAVIPTLVSLAAAIVALAVTTIPIISGEYDIQTLSRDVKNILIPCLASIVTVTGLQLIIAAANAAFCDCGGSGTDLRMAADDAAALTFDITALFCAGNALALMTSRVIVRETGATDNLREAAFGVITPACISLILMMHLLNCVRNAVQLRPLPNNDRADDKPHNEVKTLSESPSEERLKAKRNQRAW